MLFLDIFLLATAATAFVIPRDANSIKSHLEIVNADYQSLAQADATDNTTKNPVPVEAALAKTRLDTMATTANMKTSSQLSTFNDFSGVMYYINYTLMWSIKAAIQATEANKAQIAKAGLTSTVREGIEELKADTDSMGVAVAGFVAEKYVSIVQNGVEKLDELFDEAIGEFS